MITVLIDEGVFVPLNFFTFSTILSNLLAAGVLLEAGRRQLTGAPPAPDMWRGAAVVYMTVTSIVFAVLLRDLQEELQTHVAWDDSVLHRVAPMALMVDWLIEPPRGYAGARMEPVRILFVCTHNSARSQMAEGLLRARGGDAFEAHSAGTEVTAVRPEAVAVMRELGIGIAGHESKALDRYLGERFDWVITVCDEAREACPAFAGARHTAHWSIEDPSRAGGTDEERLATFRRIRDELAARIDAFLADARGDQAAGGTR